MHSFVQRLSPPAVLIALALTAGGVLGVMACGSGDDDGSGGTSAGGGTASPTTAARTFCQLSSQVTQTCGFYTQLGAACAQALYAQSNSAAGIDECAAGITNEYLPAYTAIETMCGGLTLDCSCVTGMCTDAAAPAADAYTQCVHAQLAALVPTAAQQKLKADFCATCPPTGKADDGCTSFFDADAGSVGSVTLLYSDTSIAGFDQACTGSALLAFDAGLAESCSTDGFARCFAQALATLPDGGGDPTSSLPAACIPDAGP